MATTAATATTTSTARPAGGAPPVLALDADSTSVRPAVVPTGQAVEGSITTADGRTRTYRIYVPPSVAASDASVPLLLALHGGLGWGAQFERNSGYDGLAEANGFIVVYPDGVNAGTATRQIRTWNGGDCCGPAVRQDIDDVGFLAELIEHLEGEYPVDPAEVVATGHSNGGILALRLACERADLVSAIGFQSSALEIDPCEPSQPVSVLQIHGADDQNLPLAGGVGAQAVSGVAFNPPKDAATTFASADRCAQPPVEGADPANPDLTTTVWAPCDGGAVVAFVEVAGGTHAWMGHTGGSGLTGTPYPDLDSSSVIWDFLSRRLGT